MVSRDASEDPGQQEVVLDASALLAYLQDEPGADPVEEALAVGCRMSAVNWSEVLSKTAELGQSGTELSRELTDRGLLGQTLAIVPFEQEDAPGVGDLRPRTRHLGLSLGDRVCLALGQKLRLPVLTTDRDWRELAEKLRLEIRVIR